MQRRIYKAALNNRLLNSGHDIWLLVVAHCTLPVLLMLSVHTTEYTLRPAVVGTSYCMLPTNDMKRS